MFLTGVEASPKGRPGFVVFPKVSQVPVALILHQTDHLFVFTDKEPKGLQLFIQGLRILMYSRIEIEKLPRQDQFSKKNHFYFVLIL